MKVILIKKHVILNKMVVQLVFARLEDCRLRVIKLQGEDDLETVRLIQREFKKVKEARMHKYHFHKEDLETIDRLEKLAKNGLSEWIFDILKGLNALIVRRRFISFEKTMKTVRTISQELGQVFDKEGKMQDDLKKVEQSLTENIKLDGKKFSPYTADPPSDLYVELKEVQDLRPIYGELWITVKKDITKKFRGQLVAAKQSNYRESQRKLRLLRSILRHLPKQMKDRLEPELDGCEEDITKTRETEN